MTPRLAYPVREAAQLLGISERSVRYLLRSGRLGFAKIGRRLVVPHAELEKLLRKMSVKATEPMDADESIRPVGTPQSVTSGAPNGNGALARAEGDEAKFYGITVQA